MRYNVVLTDEVKAQLRAIPTQLRRQIGHKLVLLEDDLQGNVKKLKDREMNTDFREGEK